MTGTQVIAVLSLIILAGVITLLIRLNPKSAADAWQRVWGYFFGGALLLVIVAILLPVFGMPLVERGARNWFGAAEGPITVVWKLITTVSRNDRLEESDYKLDIPELVPTAPSDFQALVDEALDTLPAPTPPAQTRTTVVISGTERITTTETITAPPATTSRSESANRALVIYAGRLEEARSAGDMAAGLTIVEEMLTDPLLASSAATTSTAATTRAAITEAQQIKIRWLNAISLGKGQTSQLRRILSGYLFVVTEIQRDGWRGKWSDREWSYIQCITPGWLYGVEFRIKRGHLFEMSIEANKVGGEFEVR